MAAEEILHPRLPAGGQYRRAAYSTVQRSRQTSAQRLQHGESRLAQGYGVDAIVFSKGKCGGKAAIEGGGNARGTERMVKDTARLIMHRAQQSFIHSLVSGSTKRCFSQAIRACCIGSNLPAKK
jgi:hypothetical protein